VHGALILEETDEIILHFMYHVVHRGPCFRHSAVGIYYFTQ